VPGVPILRFQRVPEPKLVKNRVHLDVAVADLEEASRTAVALGGRRLSEEALAEYHYRWLVMADPEGNEFCVVIREEG
jgi:predicted enzyme related to lactoylglutathione lyase